MVLVLVPRGAGIWEQVPSDRVEEARSLVYEAIEHIRDADGAITVRVTIRITTATT